jgi:hypothetical protein
MAECAYYFKAEFISKKDAQMAQQKITEFIDQATRALNFYQNVRSDMPHEEFWKKFGEAYPLVYAYAQTLPEYLHGNREPQVLSGYLDFGQDGNTVDVEGTTVQYSDSNVWHNTNWGYFCQFVEKEFRAIKAGCGTEEDGTTSLDSIQLYDYVGIVTNLLKHPELFPVLIRVHPDLDGMIDILTRNSKKGTRHEKS